MSSHSCLKITDCEGDRIMLYTSHTGMDIPLLPELVFKMVAERYKHLVESSQQNIYRILDSNCALERLEYANSAAALCIAAKPFFLEPLTPKAIKNLPKWSGREKPYELKISNQFWQIFDEEKKMIRSYSYWEEICSLLTI